MSPHLMPGLVVCSVSCSWSCSHQRHRRCVYMGLGKIRATGAIAQRAHVCLSGMKTQRHARGLTVGWGCLLFFLVLLFFVCLCCSLAWCCKLQGHGHQPHAVTEPAIVEALEDETVAHVRQVPPVRCVAHTCTI